MIDPNAFEQLSTPLLDPMLLTTREGCVLAANPAAAAFLSTRSSELAGRPIAELVDDPAAHVAKLLAAASRSTEFTVGTLNWRSAGERRMARFEGALVPDSGEPALVIRILPGEVTTSRFLALNEKIDALAREIAERRHAEAALRRSEERLSAILENSSTVIFLKDHEGRYVLVNRQFERAHGMSRERTVNRTDYDLFSAELAESLAANDRAVLSAGHAVEFEETVPHADGPHTYISMKFPVRDPETGSTGVGGIATDITERKRFEEKLREAQKLESLGVLAGGIAHDFNNLLTGILGNSSLALEVLPAGSEARACIEDVVRASERAAHLTRQMLAYAGKGRFVVETVDLSALVREIAHLVRSSVPKTVQVRLELAPDLPPVEADPGQLQQLIMNLVINAAEAIGEDRDGTVVVTTGPRRVDAEYLRAGIAFGEIQPGLYVSLEVRDTGAGMDAATLERIFDPFFTTKFTGRGLGLSAVQGIVRGHKGAIRVHTSPGHGTTFEVVLPASPRRSPEQPAVEAVRKQRGSGTVLIVDDEDVVRRSARKMLESHGYTVLTAENGREAVEMLGRDPGGVQAVLLDLTMPGMSGEETFRHLRAIRPDLCVVLSSGYNEVEVVRRFTAKGIAGFIQKPYTAARLAEKIGGALNP